DVSVKNTLKDIYKYKNIVNQEKDCYWYHPDHLGSSSWITYTDGSAVQHLHYLPWGEDFVDQRTTNWNARHTFSAKEKDVETGLSYFGSRYYSSDLSIWLSVDPMSDKYPSLSPYVYCANNPIKLVDPNGETVIIEGQYDEEAFDNLQKGTNLELSMKGNTVVIVGGKVLNDNDQQLYDAINDKSVTAKIIASAKMPDLNGGESSTISGHCYGAIYSEQHGTATATNYVNINGMSALELPGAEGSGMMHEVTEAYGMGCESLRLKRNIAIANRIPFSVPRSNNTNLTGEFCGTDYGTYLYCHSKATPSPNEMNAEQSQNYKKPSPQYFYPLPIKDFYYK
ncbi:MAG: RHS repeat-associated core domain-containing protein, partial [Clostridia bacterium]|nr:RHS repeat-associated core domain-containing protein [Clostridia bacterium]